MPDVVVNPAIGRTERKPRFTVMMYREVHIPSAANKCMCDRVHRANGDDRESK